MLIAGALVVCRTERRFFKVVHINQGPVIDLEREDLVVFFFSWLREALAKRGVTYCLVTPNVEVVLRDLDGEVVPGGFDHAGLLANLTAAGLEYLGPDNSLINGVGRWMFVKDFEGIASEKDFFKSVDRSVRRQYRAADELHVQIVELPSDGMEPFFDVLSHTGERRGFDTRDDFLVALKEEFGDKCRVLLAQLDVKAGIEILESEIRKLNTEIARVTKQRQKQDSDGLRRRLEVLAEQIPPTQERIAVLRELLESGVELANLAAGIFFEHGNEYTHFMGGTYEEFMHVNLNGNNFLATSQMLRLVESSDVDRYNF
ncbi:lipid II:glycine glycyltransferase (peptidoglycan interpeptide bridge formation enzyme) [Schaalia hyovaginalis]|uniref:Lipid II:glycine glycyltransferase (Peptidoglycan interpeptide bridge formation enzyme) n=1 Tax=Schaalia hyovaginalis TaxID=29316 RepID=A0A923IYH1_9ACTO|nr:lipid II:glycine glycyltransferase (peptidoglycan interpeptide bridge formation enzyme) [Schaalia hyovaginalis]